MIGATGLYDSLLPELILAIGGALAVGMGFALFGPGLRGRYGLPDPAPGRSAPAATGTRLTGPARSRAVFLFLVGIVMAIVGVASLVAR